MYCLKTESVRKSALYREGGDQWQSVVFPRFLVVSDYVLLENQDPGVMYTFWKMHPGDRVFENDPKTSKPISDCSAR